MICVLLAGLAVMLTVVILRADSTRLNFEAAQLDRRAGVLWERLREQELELARLRNPALIQERVLQMRLEQVVPDALPTRRAARDRRQRRR